MDSNKKTIVKSAFSLMVLQSMTLVLSFVTNILVSRALSVEVFGIYSAVFAFAAMLSFFSDNGTFPIAIREISIRENQSKAFSDEAAFYGSYLVFNAILIVVGFILGFIILLFYTSNSTLPLSLCMVALASFFFSYRIPSFRTATEVPFHVKYIAHYPYFLGFLSEICFFILGIAGILLDYGINYFVISRVLVFLPFASIQFYKSFKLLKPSFGRLGSILFNVHVRHLLKEAYPIFLTLICTSVATRISIFILEKSKDLSEVAYLSVTLRLVEPLMIIPSAIATVVFPFISKCKEAKDEEMIDKIVSKYIRASYAFLLCFLVIYNVAPSLIIKLTYGNKYSLGVSSLLSILIFSEIFVYADIMIAKILIASNLQLRVLIFNFVLLFSLVVSGLVLIPKYGARGAAIAYIIGFSLRTFSGYFFKDTRKATHSIVRGFAVFVVPVVIAVFSGLLMNRYVGSIPVISTLVALVMFLLVCQFRNIFTVEDIRWFMEKIRK